MSGNSLETLSDSPFRRYVSDVSQYVLIKIEQMSKQQKTFCPEVTLYFIYRPLVKVTYSQVKAYFSLKPATSEGARNLISPWVKIRIEQIPKYSIQAEFLWNERQILLDQATMVDSQNIITESLLPVEQNTYDIYRKDYERTVLHAETNERVLSLIEQDFIQAKLLEKQLAGTPTDYSYAGWSLARLYGLADISKRLPKDIFWLFSNSIQNGRVPFYICLIGSLQNTSQRGSLGYKLLTNAIVDKFMIIEYDELVYKNVIELSSLVNLNQYKIKSIK
jgi:hypothetical protein